VLSVTLTGTDPQQTAVAVAVATIMPHASPNDSCNSILLRAIGRFNRAEQNDLVQNSMPSAGDFVGH